MKTNISWADKSLNFYNWFCTPVSAGCKNCYMFAMRKQFGREPEKLEWREGSIAEFNRLNAGEVVFVNSMSDTYHPDALYQWLDRIHTMIASKPEVTFLLLTKRPHIAYQWRETLVWPDNLWLGVSVENLEVLNRVSVLARTPAKHKFLSVEPLLEDLLTVGGKDRLTNYYDQFREIEWMIVGGESGARRRPFDKAWARELRDFCMSTGTHFTFKQGGHRLPGKDHELDGEIYLDTPFSKHEIAVVEQRGLFGDGAW